MAKRSTTEVCRGSAIVDDSITSDKYGPLSVDEAALAEDAVTGEKLAPLTNRGLDQTNDLIGITNDTGAPSTTISGITFDQQGLINSATELVATDLPEATVDDIGAIKPGTGLSVTGDGTLNHSNVIAANDIGGLTFDEEGHCTGFPAGTPPVFERDAIPVAGDDSTEVGGVYVPPGADVGLSIDGGTGELTHESSTAAAGTYPRVEIDGNGHVIAGFSQINTNELPDSIPADLISGTLPTAAATTELGINSEVYTTSIANESISRRHFSDISIAYIQETLPTNTTSATDATVFRGCLWFRESTGQLYMYNGNAWHIVAGGRLTQENLRFCGTYNAATNQVVTLTDEGAAEQNKDGAIAFTVGQPVPAADDELSGCYFLVETAGNGIDVNDVTGNNFAVGDLLLAISEANGWTQIGGPFGGGGGGSGLWEREGASPNVSLTPINAADNLDLSVGNWLKLPQDSSASGPPSDTEGTVWWNPLAMDGSGAIEVWDGAEWISNAKSSNLQWETIPAADNDDWPQDVLRPRAGTSDLAIRSDRSLLFEAGSTTNPGDSGSNVSNLVATSTLSASRTWTLPDVTGTLVTTESAVLSTDGLTIDCGTYS